MKLATDFEKPFISLAYKEILEHFVGLPAIELGYTVLNVAKKTMHKSKSLTYCKESVCNWLDNMISAGYIPYHVDQELNMAAHRTFSNIYTICFVDRASLAELHTLSRIYPPLKDTDTPYTRAEKAILA